MQDYCHYHSLFLWLQHYKLSLVCSFSLTVLSGIFITANSLKILDLNNKTSLGALPSATHLLIM